MTGQASTQPYAEGTQIHSGDLAMGLEAAIYRALSSAETMRGFQDQVAGFLASLGFDSFSYHLVGLEHKRLSPPQAVMTTMPKELLWAYEGAGYHEWDIMFDYALHNRRDMFYSKLQAELKATGFESTLKQKNEEIFRLYRLHGYHEFYLIPVGQKGRSALFTIGHYGCDPDGLTAKVASTHHTETVTQ